MKYETLKVEQTALQLNRELGPPRHRALSEYSRDFDMGTAWLPRYVQNLISSQPSSVYIDLGCGDGMALRDAKRIARKNEGSIRTIGVDILEPDWELAKLKMRRGADPIDCQLAEEDYAPELYEGDIDVFEFPEPADLVTLSSVLYWTGDPLQALANAASQVKVGGVLCANGLSAIDETDGRMKGNLFNARIFARNQPVEGFTILSENKSYADAVVLQKTDDISNPSEILNNWFGAVPMLTDRNQTSRRFFNYSYALN